MWRSRYTPDASRRAPLALSTLAVVLLVSACGEDLFVPPDPPDAQIHDVNTTLYRNFETVEGHVLEPALATLAELLTGFDLEADYHDRCYSPEALGPQDVADIEHPGRDLGDALTVALVMATEYTPAENARGVIFEDQRPMEPGSPDLYDRTFADPQDPSCFPGNACGRLYTDNHILRDYLVLSLLYDMPKNYRWVEVGEAGSGDWALLARAWIQQEYETDGGSIQLNQSFTMDIFLPTGTGGLRYQAMWVEMTIDELEDEFILDTAAMGMDAQFVATEEFMGTL